MNVRAITDQHRSACAQVVGNYDASPEAKQLAAAILDANTWLDGLYQDIHNLAKQNTAMATKIADLESRLERAEKRLQLR